MTGQRRWQLHEDEIVLAGNAYRLRLTRFPSGWIASVDAPDGPTLGFDSSPYLAVWRALDFADADAPDAIRLVGQLFRTASVQ